MRRNFNLNSEQLIAFINQLQKPIREDKLFRRLNLKVDQKEELIFILRELKASGKLVSDGDLIFPPNYVSQTKTYAVDESSIVELFNTRKKPIGARDIIRALKVNQEDNIEKVNEILLNLELKGTILRKNGTYVLISAHSNLKVGPITMPKSGLGYVEKVRVDQENLKGALPNDIVLVEVLDYENKRSGVVRKIIKRSDLIAAPFIYENGSLRPYGYSFDYKIKMDEDKLNGIVDGDRVAIKLSEEQKDGLFQLLDVEFIAHKNDPDIEYKTIAAKYGFQTEFTPDELKELESLPKSISKADLENRVDYRSLRTITIDGADAKDMDDALSLEVLENGNYKIYVHIANVAHFIKKDSLLYDRAVRNGATSYLNGATFPMLPPEIANNVCSLKEGVDRLTRSFVMEIDKYGNLVDYDTHLSVINSDIKMTFEDVNAYLEDGKNIPGYQNYHELLNNFEHISNLLTEQSNNRGCLDFASSDIEFSVDDDGKVKEFYQQDEKTAQRIIKNLMLLAGTSTANYLNWISVPLISRVHEAPEDVKLKEAVRFINSLGYKTRMIRNTSDPRSLNKILNQLKSFDNFEILSSLLLKSLQRAKYSFENLGHYGLAVENYTQVTAPIRRIVDLETHYLLDKIDNGFDYSPESLKDLEDKLTKLANHATDREKNADNAEREAVKMEMASMMESRVGEYFSGVVTDISRHGVTVKTAQNIIGRVTFHQVCNGKYKFDAKNRNLSCRSINKIIKIGDAVRIKVLAASKENRTIDFSIAEPIKKEQRGRAYTKAITNN